ncbi:MAG: hypothetical protein ACR2J3_11460 [Aridibacter sp.]
MNEDNTDKKKSVIDNVTEALKFIGGLTVLLTFTGFLIVQANLQLYTNLRPYNVNPYIYISAGTVFIILLGFCVFGLLRLFKIIYDKSLAKFKTDESLFAEESNENSTLKAEKFAFGLGTTPLILLLLFLFIISFISKGEKVFLIFMGIFIIFFLLIVLYFHSEKISDNRPLWKLFFDNFFVTTSSILIITATSFLYGISIYGKLALGGGNPQTIQLVSKKESNSFQNIGLSMETETKTTPICQITELTDGLLVFDPISKKIVIVNNGEIIGKIEYFNKINCQPLTK